MAIRTTIMIKKHRKAKKVGELKIAGGPPFKPKHVFDYQILSRNYTEIKDEQEMLCNFGSEGWELVTVDRHTTPVYYFKRRRK